MRLLRYLGSLVVALVLVFGLLMGVKIARIELDNSSLIARWRGERDAQVDLSHGSYKQLIYGMPGPSILNYQKAMEARYNVHVVLRGCVSSEAMRAYASAYNKVSAENVNRRFGHDIFAETANQASADWDRTHEEVQSSAVN